MQGHVCNNLGTLGPCGTDRDTLWAPVIVTTAVRIPLFEREVRYELTNLLGFFIYGCCFGLGVFWGADGGFGVFCFVLFLLFYLLSL